MIREVTTYQAVCDRCGRKTGKYNSMEKLNANGDFWAWVEIDGKLYCPDCYEYDEETDEYKPKKNKIDYGSKNTNTRQL